MKLFIILLLSLCCLSSCDTEASTAPPPTSSDSTGDWIDAIDMAPIYDYVRDYQLKYIRSLQRETGAIRDMDDEDSKVTPYFANFAVMALLTDPTEENLDVVEKYMSWYFDKLNTGATSFNSNETPGSIYDYLGEAERTNGTYDSVDSYAATFLELALRYASVSDECKTWLSGYKDKLSLIAGAMLLMIDSPDVNVPDEDTDDYLSVAHYGYAVKYLMDNSEVNMGLRAAKALKEQGLITNSADFEDLRAKNAEAIVSLWNKDNMNYDYASGVAASWKVFYPDATAQLYPCLFGAVPHDDPNSKRVYDRFNAGYPDWSNGTMYTDYPWTIISYASAVMGDSHKVNEYLIHIYGLNLKNENKKMWFSAEAAALVLAIDVIRNK